MMICVLCYKADLSEEALLHAKSNKVTFLFIFKCCALARIINKINQGYLILISSETDIYMIITIVC